MLVDITLICLAIYLSIALAMRWCNKKNRVEYCGLPTQHMKEFFSVSASSSLISKGNEIPPDCPVLLIIGCLHTTNKTIVVIDDLARLLTFGWLSFNEILPLGGPLDLRLYLKNISQKDLFINGGNSNFYIRYPGDPEYPPKSDDNSTHYKLPSRIWNITIPNLPCGNAYIDFSKIFFFQKPLGLMNLLSMGLAM